MIDKLPQQKVSKPEAVDLEESQEGAVPDSRRPRYTSEEFTELDKDGRAIGDFSAMRKFISNEGFEKNSGFYRASPDLFYEGPQGQIMLPDFMLEFLYKEEMVKRGPDSIYKDRIRYYLERAIGKNPPAMYLAPDGADLKNSRYEMAITTKKRMLDEYRRVQIARMSPEDARQAMNSDKRPALVQSGTREILELITAEEFDETLTPLHFFIRKLHDQKYSHQEIKEMLVESERKLQKILTDLPNEDLATRDLVARRLDMIHDRIEAIPILGEGLEPSNIQA